MTEPERHDRFLRAQELAWDYGQEYENASTPGYRDQCMHHAQTWAMIANALRRDHV